MIIDNTFMRLIVFVIILAVMLGLELYFPARSLIAKQQSAKQKTRLIGNFSLLILSAIAVKLTLPIGLVGVALYCSEQQWGLLNLLHLPAWLSMSLSILLLDIVLYWQHRLFHKVPLLWRLHQVHHADVHVDSSTALRFHPLEILTSLAIKVVIVIILGIPAIAIILFEILVNSFAIFNHANIRLPKTIEKLTRYILVTQALHRIHHSQRVSESNCNFGFSVTWWDRLFSTYANSASKADNEIDLGLIEYPNAQQNAHLYGLLAMPFNKK